MNVYCRCLINVSLIGSPHGFICFMVSRLKVFYQQQSVCLLLVHFVMLVHRLFLHVFTFSFCSKSFFCSSSLSLMVFLLTLNIHESSITLHLFIIVTIIIIILYLKVFATVFLYLFINLIFHWIYPSPTCIFEESSATFEHCNFVWRFWLPVLIKFDDNN